MKLASATFVLLLVAAHAAGDCTERFGEPLSVFRDGEQWWLGYLLFAALLLIGLLYAAALIRAGREEEAVSAGLAALLLFIVAVTPSYQWFHLLCSLLLLGLLFGHYWWLLRASGSAWLILHAVAPFALVLACGYHSYGLWQKGMILYTVALANVRHHLLGSGAASRPRSATACHSLARDRGRGRRRVYRLQPGPVWARRKAKRSPIEPGTTGTGPP